MNSSIPKLKVLLVEDSAEQADTYRRLFENETRIKWEVQRSLDKDIALWDMEQAEKSGKRFDMVVADLGLPPGGVDNPMMNGVPLVRTLREKYRTLPILAYTRVQPRSLDFEYAEVLAALLPLRVSFAYARPLEEIRLPDLAWLVWLGFFVLSPQPADFLPEAVVVQPDPLNRVLWETLRYLSEGYTEAQVGNALSEPRSKNQVKNYVADIKTELQAVGELPLDAVISREEIVRWYRNNRVRYRRP
jgi:CheY-like chemotaxis protein